MQFSKKSIAFCLLIALKSFSTPATDFLLKSSTATVDCAPTQDSISHAAMGYLYAYGQELTQSTDPQGNVIDTWTNRPDRTNPKYMWDSLGIRTIRTSVNRGLQCDYCRDTLSRKTGLTVQIVLAHGDYFRESLGGTVTTPADPDTVRNIPSGLSCQLDTAGERIWIEDAMALSRIEPSYYNPNGGFKGAQLVWDIANEPNTPKTPKHPTCPLNLVYTTDPQADNDFYAFWKRSVLTIRRIDPNAKIVGPSNNHFQYEALCKFLSFAKNNGVLPDYLSWHELAEEGMMPYEIEARVEKMRQGMDSLGISRASLPISINEYGNSSTQSTPSTHRRMCPTSQAWNDRRLSMRSAAFGAPSMAKTPLPIFPWRAC